MRGRDRLLRAALRDRFVVTLLSGETFDGLLEDADDRVVVLVDGHALTRAERTPVDGQLYLPRDQIAYMQRPT